MPRRIEKVGVIGSGIMGGGIAAHIAGVGIPVLLLDIVPFDLKDGEKNDPKARNRIVQAGLDAQLKVKPPAFMNKKADVPLITLGNTEDDFDKLAECDLIFEVIIEKIEIKQELFAKVEKIKKPGAIVASNTSGLPLAKMSEGRSKEFKEHFVITHFFNPVRYMKLLELVTGPDTKQEVVDFIAEWGEKILGKGIVWSKDTPSFVGNRVGVQLICAAFRALEEEDISADTIDKMLGSEFGMPNTGMFALADLVGIDTILHLSDSSYDLLVKDEYRDIYKVPDYVRKMYENKMLGKKTREEGGFYKTTIDPATWKKNKQVLDVKKFEFVDYDRKALPECVLKAKKCKTLAEKQRTLIYGDSKESKILRGLMLRSSVYAANRIPEIADSIVEIDNAIRWGFAWETGPFEVWDNLGLKKSVEVMKKEGIEVPAHIKKMLAAGNETFYKMEKGDEGHKLYYDFDSESYKKIERSPNMIFLADLRANDKVVESNEAASLIDLGDGVFCLEFHTKMNAVNAKMIEFNEVAGQYVVDNGIGLVIGNQAPGMPGAFSAGGDLDYMGKLAKDGKFDEIDKFIKNAQEIQLRQKYSPIPIVAAPYGMTLGGGAEVCLSVDKIVAHADLFMGLVEIGAGLVPAGGGCTNLWRRFIENKPDGVKLADWGAFFIPMFMNIAQAKVSMSAAEARNNGFLRSTDRIVYNKDALIGEAKKEVLKMVDDGYIPPRKTKIPVMGGEALGMIHAELFNMASGGYVPPHMGKISKKIAYIVSGGEAQQGMSVTEEYMMSLEREAFVDLWKTEETQKMAAHIMKTGKPLML